MNTQIKVSKAFAHLPVERLAEGLSVGGFASIGIKGQRWSLRHQGESYPFTRDDDGSPLTYLDVVIVGRNPYTSKLYFGDAGYTEESAAGPICASVKGDVPDPGVPVPQNKICATCKNNQFGTGQGGRGKACQDNRRLAVMLMPKMTLKMLGSPLLEPVFFKVPPASLKTFGSYSDSLAHQGLPFAAVVTRMSFNPEKNWEIQFKLVEALSDKAAEVVLPLLDDPTTMQILGQPSSGGAPALAAPIEQQSDDLVDAFAAAKPVSRLPSPLPNEDRQLRAIKKVDQETEAPVKRGRGRPPGSGNKPKLVEPEQIEATAVENNGKSEDQGFESSTSEIDADVLKRLETDSEIDPNVNALLSDKMQDMFK